MKLKVKIFFVLFLLLTFLLSCNKSTDYKKDGKIKIKLTTWFIYNMKEWEGAIKEFERTHPQIEVEIENVVYSMHVQKLLTSSAAKVPIADLIILEDWFATEMLERDYFIDLKDKIYNDLDTSLIFLKPIEDYKNSKGEIIAFPNFLISSVLFYNKDIFDNAKLSYPDSTWTYDDFLQAAKKLTRDKDGDGIIDEWGIQLNYSPFLDVLLYAFGGGVLSPDRKRPMIDKPESIEAIKFFVDLYKVHKVAPVPNPAAMSNTVAFLSGKFAMAIISNYVTKFKSVNFRWDYTYPPKGRAGRVSIRNSIGFGIPKTSKNKEAAWIFLKWLIESLPPQYSTMAEGIMPNNKKLATSKYFLEGEPICNRKILPDLQENYSINYTRTSFAELKDYGFQSAIERAISGKYTIEEAAKRGNKNIEEVLKRSGE